MISIALLKIDDMHANCKCCCMQRLYRAGARKFVIAGVGSMGCIPTVLAQSVAGRCSPEVDSLVLPFNANVRVMLDGLNSNLPGARFTYLDNFRIFKAILTNPAAFGTYGNH